MPDPPVKKYYTFSDETNIEVTSEFCTTQINTIIKSYSREILLRAISQISQDLGTSNDPARIKELQKKHLNIPIARNVYLIHRQAVIVLLQFIFSCSENEFSAEDRMSPRDIFLLFAITNNFIEINEYVEINKSKEKTIFFSSIKSVHLMMNEDDLQASFFYFDKYAQAIEELNTTSFNETIKEYLGEDIASIREIFRKIKDQNYPEIFSFLEKFAVIEYDKIDTYWKNRSPKFTIPFEYNLFNQYPLIKKGEDFLVTDIFNLFNSLFSIVYEVLVEDDRDSFKGVFGKDIAEPVVTKFCEEVFKDDQINFIKVGSKSKEYADIGILYKDSIFLFEVKTSVFSRKMLYSTNYDQFIKAFNNKFVLYEGISQQVNRLIDVENNFDDFCKLSGIDQSKEYKIYPILLVFDEALQAFCVNWYLSTRFENLIRVRNFKPTKFLLSNNHSTITFNELYRLNQLDKSSTEKLELIKQYSDSDIKHPMSLTLFNQQLRQ